jgi:uncharacterized protein YndB with AHSA1/START domain
MAACLSGQGFLQTAAGQTRAMAVNEIEVAAPARAVWDVLATPAAYADWIVGTKRIRGADDGFPEVGARLYHTVGIGPVSLSDATRVLVSEPPSRLVLDARVGPLGAARVAIQLLEHDGRTTVVLAEEGTRGPNRVLTRVGELALRGRNRWSLERLKELAERRA